MIKLMNRIQFMILFWFWRDVETEPCDLFEREMKYQLLLFSLFPLFCSASFVALHVMMQTGRETDSSGALLPVHLLVSFQFGFMVGIFV